MLLWLLLALVSVAPAPASGGPATCGPPQFADYLSKAFASSYVVEGSLVEKRPRGSRRSTLRLDVQPQRLFKWPLDARPLLPGRSVRLLLDLGRSSSAAAEANACKADVWDKRRLLKKGHSYLFYLNHSAMVWTSDVPVTFAATFFPDILNQSMRSRLNKLACNSTADCALWNRRLMPNVKKLTYSVHSQRIVLFCNVTSPSDAKLRWFKDDTELLSSPNVSIQTLSNRQSSLTIMTWAADEAAAQGKYTCEARTVAGSRRSASFTLSRQMVVESLRRPSTKLTLVSTMVTHFAATLTVERSNGSNANGSTSAPSVTVTHAAMPVTCSSRNVTFLKCRYGQCLIAVNDAPYCKCDERYTGSRCDRLSRPPYSSRSRPMRAASTNSKWSRRKRTRTVRPALARRTGPASSRSSNQTATFIAMLNRALLARRSESLNTNVSASSLPTPTLTTSTEQNYSSTLLQSTHLNAT